VRSAIIGIGFLGSILARLIRHSGAQVLAISRRASSLQLATRMGANEAISLDDHNKIIARTKELTNGQLRD